MAEGLGFTGMPYPTYGVDSFGAAPPMATAVSQPVASSSTHTGICESMPRRHTDDYQRPAMGVYMTRIPGYSAPRLAIPCQHLASPLGMAYRALSHVGEGAKDQEDAQTSP